jgi:hypothetical protein
MRRRKWGSRSQVVFFTLLLMGWVAAYVGLPRTGSYDGPFNAEPFSFQSGGLPFISKVELEILGFSRYTLESRENLGAAPGTVFVLKDSNGGTKWTRLGAPELGRIHLESGSAKWFTPGGWVIRLKPEHTGGGVMYVSPLGEFRFFFHSW